MFAVIRTGGKQYRVAIDDLITVERLQGEAGDAIALDQVLMVGEGDRVDVGAPLVDGASVAAEIVEQGRGDKILVFKKRRRQNYRRKKGHRQHLTTLKVTEILTGGAQPSAKPAKAAAPAPAAADTAEAPAAEEIAPQQYGTPPDQTDDLTKIAGVGPKLAELLNELGIYTFAQIAAWTPENVAWVDARLKFKGRIERDDWIAKSKELSAE